jgi:Cu(I)/Ag(I) efflux system membrane protein CusA/SilA
VNENGTQSLADLRSFQDWYLRYWLQSVPGVAEVASIGGFVKQYQVQVDPVKLQGYGVGLSEVIQAVRRSNNEVGGRVIEASEREYMVRGRGYIRSLDDLRSIPVGTDQHGTPITVQEVAHVTIGPDMRRGVAELDGTGEVVGGIVIMRYGENALDVIDRVKKKLKEIEPSIPEGIRVVPVYDRSDLILRAIATLKEKLIEISVVVSLVSLVFLFHLRSALVPPILLLPVAVLLSFIAMYYLGITSNVMSLSGIAIAIGAMVDAVIVMVENAHRRLEEWEQKGRIGSREEIIIRAAQEVGKPLFFSLLIITVSFLPIFTLEAQGPLVDALAHSWSNHIRTSKSFEPISYLDLYPPGKNCVACPMACGGISHWGDDLGVAYLRKARVRIHAPIERRHNFVYADIPSGFVYSESQPHSPNPGSIAERVS